MTADDAEAADLMKALLILADRIDASDVQERRRISAAHLDAIMLLDALTEEDEDTEQARIDACMERVRAYSDAGDVAAQGWRLAALEERLGMRNYALWAMVRKLLVSVKRDLPTTEATALH
mgnify:CR=1 FL=1